MRINLNDKNKQFDRMFKIMESLENQTLLTEGADYSGLQYKNFNQKESSIFDDHDYTTGKNSIKIISYATDELSNSGSPGIYVDFRNYWIVEYNSKKYLIEVEPGRQTSTQEDRDKREKNQKDGNGEITYVWEIQNK